MNSQNSFRQPYPSEENYVREQLLAPEYGTAKSPENFIKADNKWETGFCSCFQGSNFPYFLGGLVCPFVVFGLNYKSLKELNGATDPNKQLPVTCVDSVIGCCPCDPFVKSCIPHAIPTLAAVPFNFWWPAGLSGTGAYALQYGLCALALIPIGFEFCLRRSIRANTISGEEGKPNDCVDCLAVYFCQAFALMQEHGHLTKLKTKDSSPQNTSPAMAPRTTSQMYWNGQAQY